MSRRGRKQIMSKSLYMKQKCFFDERTLIALHDCESPHELSPTQDEAWRKLKSYLQKQPYTIWCTHEGWENFLMNVIERDREGKFFGELRETTREYKGDLFLTDDLYLKKVKALTRSG